MNRDYVLVAALAPLLGTTQTLPMAAVMGGCAVLMVGLHQALLMPLRNRLHGAAYVLASLLILAGLASCLQLALRAWLLPMALLLGPYPALLCLTCLAMDRLLPEAGRWRSLLLHLGGLLAAYLVLGACRQGLGVQLANLAPGALLLLGLLLALYNHLRPGPAHPRLQGKP
ncbi:Rnf-Nqr domain containing protein [Pseudomonas sp. LAIL14HWK12:I7]|jgi:Predicted NADH:ubiquinone oxidoreductase, subunit RnfE|uniref:Rnf-Nqr domain containing protein n=1 Tax=Pseudomonas sp. LAIL14HWK12:I7 TaxID=1259801 RepID=UPI0004815113|nr:Rnf-Nqr domain containing protein [Pseudomonas sp. LAIL14HWK12:I7]